MFGLTTPLSRVTSISPRFLRSLEKLGLKTVKDLIWHFPSRYEDFSQIYQIADLEPGQQATINGVIREVKLRRSFRRHMAIVEAVIDDGSGTIRGVWFNQPYLKNTLRVGRMMNFSGKVSVSENDIYLSHPDYEQSSGPLTHADWTQTDAEAHRPTPANRSRHTARLVPIYPETKGLSSRALRFILQPVLQNLSTIPEFLPPGILKSHSLPEINEAIQKIHFPDNTEEVENIKKRFAFQDLFLLQLFNLEQKLKLSKEKAPKIETDIEYLKKILTTLPFELTTSQKKSLWEIIQDFVKPQPMNRLLQGDVGSGKTVVAALSAFMATKAGFQAAFMAPTEVLANQHFETIKKLFARMEEKISGSEIQPVGILTSSGGKIFFPDLNLEKPLKKAEMRKKIQSGEVKIAIGTHSLIQKTVKFKNLGLIIIDEQHRFGVKQRSELLRRQSQTETPTNAENYFLYSDITFEIRKCLFEIKKKLGLGHKEFVYQNAFEVELKKSNVSFDREKALPVRYEGKKIGIYQPDFIIENKIIVELKALPFLGDRERKQIWTYLKGSDYKLALMANFSSKDIEIYRIVYDTARGGGRESAFSQRQSALVPHFLSMSATPIPRTLMLTVFGDLDVSIINEQPKGRKTIETKIIPPEGRTKAYQFIKTQVKQGRQAFVICPRIEPSRTNADNTLTNAEKFPRASAFSPRESALWEVRSVKEEHEKLSTKIFPDLSVGMLHGQLKAKQKEEIMNDFRSGKIQILVSTSVVEVGVDVPNAVIMMIEGADRFGLAQLYQFRGRVGRGEHQSFCFLFTDSEAKSTQDRLKAVVEAKSGFELAEKDLKIRGPGEFLGRAQAGLPDLAMQALQNPELIKFSREAAIEIIKKDAALKKYPALREKFGEFSRKIHQE